MEIKHLKAAYQLAEMEHNADPKNEGKKHVYDQALTAYEQAAEAEETLKGRVRALTTPDQAKTDQAKPEGSEELTIEELEEMLEKKKAAHKPNAKAENQATKEATEAATLAAKAQAEAATKEAENDVSPNQGGAADLSGATDQGGAMNQGGAASVGSEGSKKNETLS